MLKTLIAAAMAVAALAGAAAAECDCEKAAEQPRSANDRWITSRLNVDLPPFIPGAITQIRDVGEGRFAVMCERGAERASIAYRPPGRFRRQLVQDYDKVPVTFTIDGNKPLERELRYDQRGRYWYGAFGPNSRLAGLMKAGWNLRISVEGIEGVTSTSTLTGSWRAIEEMFAICREGN